jgi:hypothetical protein
METDVGIVDSPHYEVLSLEEVVELNEVILLGVCETLDITRTIARVLLEEFKWDVDEVVNNFHEFGLKILLANVDIPFPKSNHEICGTKLQCRGSQRERKQ